MADFPPGRGAFVGGQEFEVEVLALAGALVYKIFEATHNDKPSGRLLKLIRAGD